MRIIPDQLKSRNLVPFKKRHGRYNIPGMARENQVLMDGVDSDLSSEEQSYIRHYLGYADALIRAAEENAPLDLTEGDSSENAEAALSRPEEAKEQLPFDQPPIELTNEPGPDEQDPAERAA
ncbi:MAG: hypothetical protein JWM83_1908 [Candidatus Angelobacter sp.]|nr:hypothetical protein [Candidatus Angelobacter sp.]